MTSWSFAYIILPWTDETSLRRFISLFEQTFGLLTPDESRVWDRRRIVIMLRTGGSPRELWTSGRLGLAEAAWMGRN